MKRNEKLYALIFTILLMFCAQYTQAQWEQVSEGLGTNKVVRTIIESNDTLFAGTYSNTSPEGVFMSLDNGEYWYSTSLANKSVYDLLVFEDRILAATYLWPDPTGVYISTTNGMLWYPSEMDNTAPREFAVIGHTIFVAMEALGVYKSVDAGETWETTNFGNDWVNNLTVIGDTLFAGMSQDPFGVFYSPNLGETWHMTDLNDTHIYALASHGQDLYAGTVSTCWYSNDRGASWKETTLTKRIRKLTCYQDYVFAGVDYLYGGGIYRSSDKGNTWVDVSDNLPTTTVAEIVVIDDYIYIGTAGQSIWRRPLDELVGIENNINFEDHTALQCIPNPAKDKAGFVFNTDQKSHTRINIMDLTGKIVAVALDQQLDAGKHEIEFNTASLSEGMYVCKLISGYNSCSIKLVVSK